MQLNDEFTFQYTVVEEGVTTFSEPVNFTVDSTPTAIADPLTDIINIGYVSLDRVFRNGTAINFIYTLLLFGVIFAGGFYVVPTGNFTLLGELLMDSLFWTENTTLVNDGTKWGVRVDSATSDLILDLDVHYLKADGFISYYSIAVTNKTSGIASSAKLVRDGTGLDIVGLLTDNILYVGIAVGVIVILGAVVCMRRK